MGGSEWYYLEAERETGPVTQEQLLVLLRTRLPRGTLVWRDGFAEWTKAEEAPELAALLAASPPRVPPPPPRGPRVPERRPAAAPPASGDAPTWNPVVLMLRCFQWGGRFSRSEYAVVYFINLVLTFGLVFGLILIAALAGSAKAQAASAITSLLIAAWGLVALVVSVGAGIRRLHDLGKPGWWILAMLVPCVNFLMLLYLLFAPGQGEGAGSAVPALVIAAALVLLMVPVIGIVAAIAIPSLLRARISANEAATIGDIRTIISAQAAYQSASDGAYASRLECLSRPADCLDKSTSPPFVDASTIVSPKNGYVRELVAGPQARGSSTNGYAFLAYPVSAGQTGVRSFCGDASGRVCYDARGAKDLVEAAEGGVRCSTMCAPLD
jgi:uncharacterized membrane protein YhaH (DUF805 family)